MGPVVRSEWTFWDIHLPNVRVVRIYDTYYFSADWLHLLVRHHVLCAYCRWNSHLGQNHQTQFVDYVSEVVEVTLMTHYVQLDLGH